MTNVEQSRQFSQAVAEVLMSKWDPIGVNDVPEAAGEYDEYVDGVCKLLNRGVSDEDLAKHLLSIETNRMGLTDAEGKSLVPAEHRAEVVSALQSLKCSSE